MIFNRDKRSAVTAEDAAADPAVPEVPAVPTDLAAAAEQLRQEAAAARNRAERGRAEAQAVVTDAEQEAARITSEARTKALAIVADATADDRQAAADDQRGQHLAHAADLEIRAGDAERQADALAGERDRLSAEIADLDGELVRLGAKGEQLATDFTAACQGGDLDAITAVRNRIASAEDRETMVGSLRATVLARAEAIGNGDGPGELGAALTAAAAHRAELRRTLNELYPDRPEAVADRLMNEFRGALAGNLERIAEASKPGEPRHIVAP